jgi:hypothetical protein
MMKKTLIAFVLATFFMSMPLFSEARATSEPTSLNGSALEYNQSSGVGRIRSRRRQVRRRRGWQRRHVRRHMRRKAVRRRVRRSSGHDH